MPESLGAFPLWLALFDGLVQTEKSGSFEGDLSHHLGHKVGRGGETTEREKDAELVCDRLLSSTCTL